MSAAEEMSYEQIAETLGLSLGAVKTKIHRARLKLGEMRATGGEGGDNSQRHSGSASTLPGGRGMSGNTRAGGRVFVARCNAGRGSGTAEIGFFKTNTHRGNYHDTTARSRAQTLARTRSTMAHRSWNLGWRLPSPCFRCRSFLTGGHMQWMLHPRCSRARRWHHGLRRLDSGWDLSFTIDGCGLRDAVSDLGGSAALPDFRRHIYGASL